MVREVEAKLGPIDILVNNAGITRDGTFHRMKAEQWTDVINTNLNSVFNVTRPVIEGMRERKWGRIIQISSINGLKGQSTANQLRRGQGRHARLHHLARANAKHGVTVNTISPGCIATDMVMAVPRKCAPRSSPTSRPAASARRRKSPTASASSPTTGRLDHRFNLDINGGHHGGW